MCGAGLSRRFWLEGISGIAKCLWRETATGTAARFWPADQYAIGQSPPSFDKQFVRDYLETLDWKKTPPAPSLPKDVIAKTSAKYIEAFERLTSEKLL